MYPNGDVNMLCRLQNIFVVVSCRFRQRLIHARGTWLQYQPALTACFRYCVPASQVLSIQMCILHEFQLANVWNEKQMTCDLTVSPSFCA